MEDVETVIVRVLTAKEMDLCPIS